MGDYQDELLANYDELRKSRGWDWNTMADSVEVTDPVLAAELRKQGAAKSRAADDSTPPAEPKPKARRAPAKSTTASK